MDRSLKTGSITQATDSRIHPQRQPTPLKVRSWGPGASIGIVGGMGEMGRLFADFFDSHGFRVSISDRGPAESARQMVASADMVLFAVPLHETVDIIRDLLPYTQPDQLLMDLSSLKVGPVGEMLKSSSSVLGLHPMFNGHIRSFSGQTMIACPVRIDETAWWKLKNLFQSGGIHIKECSPEEHDRMMSVIQVLFHVTTMLAGRVLREMGVDIMETLDFTSPSYRLEINLLGRMFAQKSTLYAAITQMNPYSRKVLELLEEGLGCYQDWYDVSDFGAFVADFEKSSRYLGEFCRDAFRESSELLDFAVQLPKKACGR